MSERYETLLVHGRLPDDEASMAAVAEQEGARTVYVPTLMQPVSPVADFRALITLIRLMRRFRPDIVHTHTAKAGFLGRAAALMLRPPPRIVHTYHGHVLEGYFGKATTRLFRALERLLAARSDRLVGVSRATVDDLVRLRIASPDRFQVIRLGLDLDGYRENRPLDRAELRHELAVTDAEILAVYVGRVVPIKRVDLLLEAFAMAIAGGAAVKLAIVGDGSSRAGLETRSTELGISADVRFLGYRSDLERIFAAADLGVISSDNEGTPVSLIEAGAAGKAAVATDVGGVSEVVRPDTGRLAPRGDSQALAQAIVELAASRNLRARLGTRARAHVMTSFGIDRLVRDIDSLYQELISRRSTEAKG